MISLYLPLSFLIISITVRRIITWKEVSFFLFMLIYLLAIMLPLGVGFKLVGYNIGLDNLSLRLGILSLWVRILMLYSRSLIFIKKNSEILFMRIVIFLLMTLLVRFLTVNLFMFYFFFWILFNSHINSYYRVGVSAWTNSGWCVFFILHFNCIFTSITIFILHLCIWRQALYYINKIYSIKGWRIFFLYQ